MAASMIATFRSYQELLIRQSQCFISRTREGESRASMGTGTARGSRWAAANASAFGSLLPAMPIRSTPGLARRSGTVDRAIAPYPPRLSTSKGHLVRRKNELKRTDRPTLPYNCIGRLPREETQPATRGYTAIDVT